MTKKFVMMKKKCVMPSKLRDTDSEGGSAIASCLVFGCSVVDVCCFRCRNKKKKIPLCTGEEVDMDLGDME